MNGEGAKESDFSVYVEVDPTGRYGRYNEILGKGASKIVYRGFDEYEGIEVAWNQVKLNDFLQRPEDLERLYSEIHLLRSLKHSNIMKFYASWVDPANRNINFVTEMFTSGTLRQYRLKHKKVNIRAVKHWCRQILKGLLYLHSLDPPVIHRDLKCDNIFINGNQGQVKIGDLGLAAILRKSYAAHCVGTPEFMAPEIYEEEYNELVDIYAFGMCVLEMVTFEYPYSECTHPVQIYKKVMSGKKPDALYKVKEPEVRQFVEKCLASVSCRLSASELLKDPFLQTDGKEYDLRPVDYQRDYDEAASLVRVSLHDTHPHYGSLTTSVSDNTGLDDHDYEAEEFGTSEIELFMSPDHDQLANLDIAIKGKKREDGNIFLRIRIADKEGRIRNIYFPFDAENDTAMSVATEMVAELDITDQDVTKIADMIDDEIASLVPDWKKGLNIEEEEVNSILDQNKHSTSSRFLMDYVTPDSPGPQKFQVIHCSGHASGRARFEEITHQVESNQQNDASVPEASSSESGATHYTDIWAQHDELSGSLKQLSLNMDDEGSKEEGYPRTPYNSPVSTNKGDDHEKETRKELRWLKARYQMQLRELRYKQLGAFPGELEKGKQEPHSAKPRIGKTVLPIPSPRKKLSSFLTPGLNEIESPDSNTPTFRNCSALSESCVGPESLVTRKNFYQEGLRPHSLHRTTSLPVDVVDC